MKIGVKNSHSGGKADKSFRYGPANANWEPVVGDWDGDGDDTAGLYDQSRGIFYLKNTHSGGKSDLSFRYGPVRQFWWPLAGKWK